jgi:mannose-6-phosphate isomerase-like protein (cupin superfamily)
MKTNQLTFIGGLIMLFLFSFNAGAQELKIMNSKMNHVLADTTFLRAIEVTLNPGEKTDMHTHPANFFYALTEGKLMVHYKDGKNQSYDLKPGFAGVAGPEGPHITENAGQKTVKFLLIEVKEHPYKAQK